MRRKQQWQKAVSLVLRINFQVCFFSPSLSLLRHPSCKSKISSSCCHSGTTRTASHMSNMKPWLLKAKGCRLPAVCGATLGHDWLCSGTGCHPPVTPMLPGAPGCPEHPQPPVLLPHTAGSGAHPTKHVVSWNCLQHSGGGICNFTRKH